MNFDAIRFCKDFSIPYFLPGQSVKVTNGRIGIRCPNPRCKNNNKPDHGSFNLLGGYYHCWTCGSTRLEKVISWILKVHKQEANSIIQMYLGTYTLRGMLNYKKSNKGGAKKCIVPTGKLLNKHRKYLEEVRGFNPDYLIDKYKLTAVGNKPKDKLERAYKNRIIIPIIDERNRIISFQGRDITGTQKIKYKGCTLEQSVINYKHSLYGLPFANSKQCCLVEGVVDQWSMGDGFLATFGISVTSHQIKLMSYFDRIFILFDPEPNAQDSAQKIATKLAALNKEVEIIQYDGDVDPGELPESEVKYIRRELGFV